MVGLRGLQGDSFVLFLNTERVFLDTKARVKATNSFNSNNVVFTILSKGLRA